MRNARGPRAIVALSLAVTLAAVACTSKDQAEVTSPWPTAEAERVVPRPPEPPRWPLTGSRAPNAGVIRRRVISVKIENSPQSRPQSGLQAADVVYESLAEGGITRFNALFHSNQPKTVGPVRSARLSDLYIVPQYRALFAFSGANRQVNGRIRKAGIENLSEDAGVVGPFYRSSAKAAPHNLFVILASLVQAAAKRGWPRSQSVKPLQFDRRSVETSVTATRITIRFSDANTAEWTYDPETRRYMRVNNRRPHFDSASGKQISARNVVVMWARTGNGVSGRYGETFDIVLTGKNRASVFRDGKRLDGTWEAEGDAPPVFRARDGTPIKLAQGNTWFQVVPTSVNIAMR